MKKMIIAAALMIGMASVAQEKPAVERKQKIEKASPEKRSEKMLEKMTSELNLSASQQKEMKAILLEKATKREAKMEERKKLTDAEREARKAEMKATDAKIKAILTPEQTKKWEVLKAERKKEFKEGNHRNKESK